MEECPSHEKVVSLTPKELAAAARELVQAGRLGTLSTVSSRKPGWPYGSLAPYAPDERGRPVFFFSALSAHAQNLRKEPKSSPLVASEGEASQALSRPRVTLLGPVAAVGEEELSEVRASYLKAHLEARAWSQLGDFALYRLEPVEIHYVGGFGAAVWLTAADFAG